jgi:hypothetical protein
MRPLLGRSIGIVRLTVEPHMRSTPGTLLLGPRRVIDARLNVSRVVLIARARYSSARRPPPFYAISISTPAKTTARSSPTSTP